MSNKKEQEQKRQKMDKIKRFINHNCMYCNCYNKCIEDDNDIKGFELSSSNPCSLFIPAKDEYDKAFDLDFIYSAREKIKNKINKIKKQEQEQKEQEQEQKEQEQKEQEQEQQEQEQKNRIEYFINDKRCGGLILDKNQTIATFEQSYIDNIITHSEYMSEVDKIHKCVNEDIEESGICFKSDKPGIICKEERELRNKLEYFYRLYSVDAIESVKSNKKITSPKEFIDTLKNKLTINELPISLLKPSDNPMQAWIDHDGRIYLSKYDLLLLESYRLKLNDIRNKAKIIRLTAQLESSKSQILLLNASINQTNNEKNQSKKFLESDKILKNIQSDKEKSAKITHDIADRYDIKYEYIYDSDTGEIKPKSEE